jgi:DNA-binding NtrC family response regulator
MSIRILIVDDNEVFRLPLHRALEAAGFEVVAVPSAEDALDVLDGSTVNLLLSPAHHTDQGHTPRHGDHRDDRVRDDRIGCRGEALRG